MSELVPRQSKTPAKAGGENRYKAIQAKLAKFGKSLDDAMAELAADRQAMKTNGSRAQDTALAIAHADLDKKFVHLTNTVSAALGGAVIQGRNVHEATQEASGLTHAAKKRHAHLYGRLDEVRERPESTPRPGFWAS